MSTISPNSNLEVNGSFGGSVNTITGATTLDNTHHIVVVTGNTVTLPAVAITKARRIYHIANKRGVAINIGNYTNMSNIVVNSVPANTRVSVVSTGTAWLQF